MKKVFVFNIEGLPVMEHESVIAAAAWLSVPTHSVYSAIERKSLVKGHYYFSYKQDFNPPKSVKYNRNPLLRKSTIELQYDD